MRISKIILVFGALLLQVVPIAHAQTIVPATAGQYADATINNFGVRAGGQLYAYINAPLYLDCMSANNGAGRLAAVVFASSADFKIIKENLQLAYVQKKRVRIYSSSCYMASPTDANLQYPVISALDILTN